MIRRILIVGTGLIGASVGLALRENGFDGDIIGTGPTAETLKTAQSMGAIDSWLRNNEADIVAPTVDMILLAGPVMSILDWMQRLGPLLDERHLVTDVGSTKVQIVALAEKLYNRPGRASFLPGHPMAGKESGGAALAEAKLFQNAMWLFAPLGGTNAPALEAEWRNWLARFGARTMDIAHGRHDEICAWVSHLPQMVATALSALLEETFAADATGREEIAAIGGRALREMTRLGASPYSMWRDIAMSNNFTIAETLHALEQRLAHIRENLKTPELREQFRLANEFRLKRD
ncbi:MAG TPA: prephenate dehydrogenase/arogenate dehydrogenase family protein [Acidobacteriaceae bacterium]|jgi:prephenate dehydrogenase|nr:prephenate dehydrogenase/arogenate dehydrogenase family protein [Acidobacteriaceae bacterium]